MISFLIGFLPIAKVIQATIDIAYNLLIKLLGLIFYLASEYWGRWVLFALVIACALLYGRYHYIQQGRQSEARFCDLRIDDALRTAKKARASTTKGDSLEDWFRF